MRTFFVFACIVLVASAGNFENLFEDTMTSDFGTSVVANIQLQLESGATVDTVIESMRDVRDGLRNQLADAEAMHDATDESCGNDKAEYASGVSQAQINQAKYGDASAFDVSTLTSRKEEKTNKVRELSDREAMAQKMADQRTAENDRWEAVLAEHRMVQDMIDDVRVIVNNRLKSDEEFLQTGTNMFMTLSSKLKTFNAGKPSGLAHGYGVMFQLLAQMLERNQEAHGDQTTVNNILDLIDRVNENLDISLATEREAERERAADYVELSGRINDQVRRVKGALIELTATIYTLNERVTMAAEKMEVEEQNEVMWQQRLDDRSAECATSDDTWGAFFNNISDELAVIGKVMYLLEDKRALLARYGL